MAGGRARVAASILDADFANLGYAVKRAERAGAPTAPAVARRRQRLEAESAKALRGERSDEPVPAGVEG